MSAVRNKVLKKNKTSKNKKHSGSGAFDSGTIPSNSNDHNNDNNDTNDNDYCRKICSCKTARSNSLCQPLLFHNFITAFTHDHFISLFLFFRMTFFLANIRLRNLTLVSTLPMEQRVSTGKDLLPFYPIQILVYFLSGEKRTRQKDPKPGTTP